MQYLTGDLFTSTMPALGHGANTQGFMGAGIAKTVKAKYPEVYASYKSSCKMKELLPGGMLPVKADDGIWILNLASQDKTGPRARLEWLESSLEAAFLFAEEHELRGFAIPRIGAGYGALNWDDVKTVIEHVADRHEFIDLEVWTYPNTKA